MFRLIDHKQENLDFELFLSSHSEQELLSLKGIINKIIDERHKKKELSVPLNIFSTKLSPGESIVKYLKENKDLKLSRIARELGKNQNAIWLNYKRAIGKQKKELKDSKNGLIPIYIFRADLSYLEAICVYLRDSLNMSNKDIAETLNKSPQVLSLAYNRAKRKLQNG